MPEIVNVLNDHKIKTPSAIQNLAIPLILKGKSGTIVAQTGTGKSLTYILPIMQALKN